MIVEATNLLDDSPLYIRYVSAGDVVHVIPITHEAATQSRLVARMRYVRAGGQYG